MEAGKRSISDIFNGNRVLEIPFFQRAYVWEDKQWDRFIDDMVEVSRTNKPYFLGSVILKQQPTDSERNVGDVRTVIDGQQRLTTLNIFFKVLCLKTNNNSSFERVFKLISNKVALLHNHNDVSRFEEILNLDIESTLSGKDKITKAYNYFRDNIDIEILDFQKILTNIMFVGIDLGIEEDEQQIFDTINSLGVRLTTAELLKNYLFGRDDIKSYNENWKSVFEKDYDTKEFWDREITAGRTKRSNVDLFLYSYLQIKIQTSSAKIKTSDKINFGKVEGLFDSYKKFITDYDEDKDDIIKEIKDYAKLYKKHIDHSVTSRQLTSHDGVDRMNALIFGLENSTLIPYFLYLLKNDSKESNELEYISGYLETYILRRIICKETSKNYNQLFTERLIGNRVLTYSELKNYIEEQSTKINHMPSDLDLKNGCFNSKLVNKQAAGVLYFIESKIRDQSSHSTALLGQNRYSLEHIMPKKWINKWPSLDSEDLKIKRNRILLTLGNLTIITASLNSSIRDSSWEVKKEGTKNKKGLRYYSSGIDTFARFIEKEVWDETVIIERAEYLFDNACSIWAIPEKSTAIA